MNRSNDKLGDGLFIKTVNNFLILVHTYTSGTKHSFQGAYFQFLCLWCNLIALGSIELQF